MKKINRKSTKKRYSYIPENNPHDKIRKYQRFEYKQSKQKSCSINKEEIWHGKN